MRDTNKEEMQIKKADMYKISEIISYLIVFAVFMGSNFLKFNILNINFNIARVLMILPVIILLVDFIKTKKIEFNINNSKVKYCIMFFIIWSIYSVLTIYKAKDIMFYVIVNFYICIGTINIIFFNKYIDIRKNKRIFFNIITFDIFINCLYYMWLYFIKNQNVGGFYYNSNDLATIIVFAILISIYLFKENKQKKYRIYQAVVIIVYIFVFINIGSRACLLGVLAVITALLIKALIKNKEKIANNKLILIPIAIVCILLVVYIGNFFYKSIGTINLTPIEKADTSNNIRINLIYNGLYFLARGATSITGIGTGNTMYYLQNYSKYDTNNIYSFHNFWLEIWVEYGSIIFIGFLMTYIIICVELFKNRSKSKISEEMIFLLFWIIFIIASISSSSMLTREWLWIVLGFTISFINAYKNGK